MKHQHEHLSILDLETAKIGDSLCDMHYGLRVSDELKAMMHVSPIAKGLAHQIIDAAEGTSGRDYLNKMLWVVGKDQELVSCLYIYDDRYAKLITFGYDN